MSKHKKNKINHQFKNNVNQPVSREDWTDFIFSRKELIVAFAIFISVFCVYLLTFCKMFFFDALMFASLIAEKESGWSSRLAWANHLSFNFYGNLFWKFLKFIGLQKIVETAPPEGYSTLQVMNSLFGSLTSALFFLWLKKLTGKNWIAICFSLLLAFSNTFWWRSTDAHVYPPSVFHTFISLWLAWSYMRYPNRKKLLILACSLGLTVLMHQGNIFLIPAIAVAVLYVKKERIKNFAIFSAVTGFIIVIPYLWALTYQERILLSRDGNLVINQKSVLASYKWLLGNADYIGPEGKMDLKQNGYWKMFNLKNMTIVNTKVLMNCIWFRSGFGTPGNQFWPIVSKIIFISLSLFFFFKVKFWKKQPHIFALFVIWMGTYILIVTNFNPGNGDYWYQHLITIFILIAYSFSEFLNDENVSLLLRKAVMGLFLCSVVVIPTVNFFDSIYPISRVENNENYLKALFIKKYVEKGGVVIISGIGWNPGKVYIPSFANVGRISFDLIFCYNPKAEGLRILKNQVETLISQGMNVYALSEIFSEVTGKGLKDWNVSMNEIKDIFKWYDFKILGTYRDGMKIMQLFPKKGSAAYYRGSGISYYNAKEYNKSLEDFLNIPESSKTAFDYKLIGNCYILTNNIQTALPFWKRALQLSPSDTELKRLIDHYSHPQ
ncbi:MAG: DUF2723 domain-containing protein [Elusimicrobia bacterium]|nr:DUF2723 domain-containing protein [Elusimicrobiota bacterium]